MKRIYIILLLLSTPVFIKAQSSGCGDSSAANYYCNTAFDCIPSFNEFGIPLTDENGAPIFSLPVDFTDDNSCYYNPGCTDDNYAEYHNQGFVADYDDGSCAEIAVFGCIDPLACNYDANTNIYIDCQFSDTYYNCSGNCINDSDGDGVCDELEVLGCTDETALNYNENANATEDDGSCILAIEGCTDPTAFNYNSDANLDDGSCEPFTYGCTDPTAFNYNSDFNTDDGSCYFNPGCTDDTYLEYDDSYDYDDGSCVNLIVTGCIDNSATNYNNSANTDDGSCYFTPGCMDDTYLE